MHACSPFVKKIPAAAPGAVFTGHGAVHFNKRIIYTAVQLVCEPSCHLDCSLGLAADPARAVYLVGRLGLEEALPARLVQQ